MLRAIAVAGCGLAVLGGIGCQNFSYVQRNPQGGVIELKASDRDAAIAKLKEQEGDIVIENEVPKNKPGQLFDPSASASVKPSERMAATTSTGFGSLMANGDEEKIQIKYTKKPMGTATGGLPMAPKDDGIAQAGYQSKSGYDRTPGAGMATVGGQKSSTALPPVDFSGLPAAK